MHYEKPDCYAVKTRAVISESLGYSTEVRLLSVNGRGYMVDIREWDRRNPVARMTTEGITLTAEEAKKLVSVISEMLGLHDEEDKEETDGTVDQGPRAADV